MWFIDLAERDAFQDLESRRRGKRENAVGAVDRALAVMEAGDKDLVDAKCFDADARADDVSDGIERADFVKFHVFGRLAVDLPLGHRDALKDGERMLLHELGEFAVLDQLADLAVAPAVSVVMAMAMGVPVPVFVAMLVIVMVVDLAAVVVIVIVAMGMHVMLVAFVRVFMAVLVSMLMFVFVFVLVSVTMRVRLAGSVGVLMRMLVLVGVGMRVAVSTLFAVLMMMVFVLVTMIMVVRVPVFMGVSVLMAMAMAVIVTAARLILIVRVGRALMDAKLHAFDCLTLGAVEVHVKVPDIELGKFPLECGGLDAEIDEGADGHIAADAGETIEEENFHGRGRGAVIWNGWPRVRAGSRHHRRELCR